MTIVWDPEEPTRPDSPHVKALLAPFEQDEIPTRPTCAVGVLNKLGATLEELSSYSEGILLYLLTQVPAGGPEQSRLEMALKKKRER